MEGTSAEASRNSVDSTAMLEDGNFAGLAARGRLRDRQATDAAGIATVKGPLKAPRMLLRLTGQHLPVLVQPLPQIGPGEVIDAVVSAGAILKGRVEPVEIVAELKPSVVLEPKGGIGRWIGISPSDPTSDTHRVRDDGTFDISDLPNGRFDVALFGEFGDSSFRMRGT